MIINISEIIEHKIKQMENDNIIEKTIKEAIEKTIVGTIEGMLDTYTIKNMLEDKRDILPPPTLTLRGGGFSVE